MSELPRILFVTNEAPHNAAAGAIILQRLFASYPADRLMVVTNNPPPEGSERLSCKYVFLPLMADRLNRTRIWQWRNIARVLGGPALLRFHDLDQAVADFSPDLVVTVMQDSWYYEWAASYALKRKLPLVLFIHDVPSGFEPVCSILRARQAARDGKVYRQAKRRLCVSTGMAEYFERVFGICGDVLLPPRSEFTPFINPACCAVLKRAGQLTLGYAGGLHYGYGEQLLKMLPLLRQTGSKLELFGPFPSGNLVELSKATDVVRCHGYISPPEAAWKELVANCDVVLQPYLNPPGGHERQYRTHFPSKLGDCLSLGLPLLITGPEYASGVDWCIRHPGCAEIVTDKNPDALAVSLHRLASDPEHRVVLAQGAQSVANEFDIPALRSKCYLAIQEAARANTT